MSVTWSFVETTCFSSNGGCKDALPRTLDDVRFTVPNIDSRGHYAFSSPHDESGDLDFSFVWGHAHTPGPPCVGFDLFQCDWRIDWASSQNGLSLSVDYWQAPLSDAITIRDGSVSLGSDAFLPGCGDFVSCRITGEWQLAPVPEPMGSASALGLLLLLAAALRPVVLRVRNG